MSAGPKRSVLGEALQEALGGRAVRAALFTTFVFDPGFFEEHVLTLFFPEVPFSKNRAVSAVQLDEALRPVDDVAVYYDRSALAVGDEPARSNVSRIDVRRNPGVFHPKLVLILVDDPDQKDKDAPVRRSLIVGALSANLTRHGWWESVEAAHFEEIPDRTRADEPADFRSDLLDFLQVLAKLDVTGPQTAWTRIHNFLRDRTLTGGRQRASFAGRFFTRMFFGQAALGEWLTGLNLWRHAPNLEIVSPFFDEGSTRTIEALVEGSGARQCRIYLPHNDQGLAGIREDFYDAVAALPQVEWADLPAGLLEREGGRWVGQVPRRHVHAKIYRFWNTTGLDVALVGSVNCTSAGTSPLRAGNLEVAFWTDLHDDGTGGARWWLRRLEEEPTGFVTDPDTEEEEASEIGIEISLAHDWGTKRTAYLLHAPLQGPMEIATLSNELLARVESPEDGRRVELPEEASAHVARQLLSSSILEVRAGDARQIVLVREEGWSFRPSLLENLTPEEILHYWSLLSPVQRASLIEAKLTAAGTLDASDESPDDGALRRESIFDRFAGLFHAFGRLGAAVDEAIDDGRFGEAQARLFGEKYDSLPKLLDLVYGQPGADAVRAYLTYLCALQLRRRVEREYRGFFREQHVGRPKLESRLARLGEMRARVLALPPQPRGDAVTEAFLEWYEEMFLKDLTPPDLDEEEAR